MWREIGKKSHDRFKESIRFRGLGSFLNWLFFGSRPEAWIPAPKDLLPLFIQHVRTYLQQQVRAAFCPLYLLVLHHAFAHNLIHGGLHKTECDPFAVAITLALVRNERLIALHIGVQVFDLLQKFRSCFVLY